MMDCFYSSLHLEYERKLMEQYTNKTSSGQSSTTPKSGRTNTNGYRASYHICFCLNFCFCFSNTTDSPHRRKNVNQATSLLSTTNSAISTNGHSDFESGDETQPSFIKWIYN